MSKINLSPFSSIGRVGRDLTVASVPDTGSASGRQFDLSVTATIGPGAGVSGSVGVGKTTGSTNWVERQTSITAADKVDIRTEKHTQLDGALIASDRGNLKLDTETLGYSDIAGKDKEHSYYVNVGGSTKASGGKELALQDKTQVGKGKPGESGWSISGYDYEKDRQQIVRATVGEGDITVRGDAQSGTDSTSGLNRDVDKAYEVTKDHEERTDIYASKSSLEAVADPVGTVTAWKESVENTPEHIAEQVKQVLEPIETLTTGFKEGVRQAELIDKFASGTPTERAEASRELLRNVTRGESDTANGKVLADALANLAQINPSAAADILVLLGQQNGNGTQQNLTAKGGVSGLFAAVAEVLIASGANQSRPNLGSTDGDGIDPTTQLPSWTSGTTDAATLFLAKRIILTLYPGLYVSPIFQPDSSPLTTPVVDTTPWAPGSSGFGAGGRVELPTHTGGDQIPQVESGNTGFPASELPAPGNMYSEITRGDHAKLRGAEGRPVGSTLQDLNNSRPSDLLVQDDGRWVVKGSNGRVHVLEPDGEIVTSFKNPSQNTNRRISEGRWNIPTSEQINEFKDRFSGYIRW